MLECEGRSERRYVTGGPTSHWCNWVESVMRWQHFSRAPVPSVQYSLTPWEEKLNWKPPKRKCLCYRVVECITRNITLTKVRQCFNLTEVFLPLSNLDGLICLNTFFPPFFSKCIFIPKQRASLGSSAEEILYSASSFTACLIASAVQIENEVIKAWLRFKLQPYGDMWPFRLLVSSLLCFLSSFFLWKGHFGAILWRHRIAPKPKYGNKPLQYG